MCACVSIQLPGKSLNPLGWARESLLTLARLMCNGQLWEFGLNKAETREFVMLKLRRLGCLVSLQLYSNSILVEN